MLGNISKFIKENLILFIAVCITAVIYFQFLSFSHISWDDPEMVFNNKAVKEFNLQQFFTAHYVGNYIPLTMLFHGISWLIFDNADWGHHFVNILFHLANGIWVFQLSKNLFKNLTVANTAAILFLLHPLQIESVGWIAELKNVLSAFFFLAGLVLYTNNVSGSLRNTYFISFLFFVLACLSKSSAVVFPICLVAIDFLQQKKLLIKSLTSKIPFFIVSVLFGLINIKTQTADQFINHAHEFPIYQRIGFAGFALIEYMGLFIFPLNQSVIYPYPPATPIVFTLGYLTLFAIAGLTFWFIKKKNRNATFLIIFSLSNLILVLQFIPFGEALFADRYMYIPIIGFALMLGFLISGIKIPNHYFLLPMLFLVALFTFKRVKVWTSALSIYEDIIKKHPGQFVALNSAGVECMFLNYDAKALDYLNKAVKAAPANYKGFYNRGLLYLKNNQPEQALRSFEETLKLYDYNKAYIGRASAYYMLKDFPKAIRDANYVLQDNFKLTNASASKAHFILGNCYNDMNQLDRAMQEYNTCIDLNNEDPDFYFKRAIVFGKNQDFRSCLNDLEICLMLNKKYYEAYYWKGVAKVNLKLNPCEDFKMAALQNFQPAINAYNKYCR